MRIIATILLLVMLTVTGCAAAKAAGDFLFKARPAAEGSADSGGDEDGRLETLAKKLLPIAEMLGFAAAGAAAVGAIEGAGSLYRRTRRPDEPAA